MDFVFFRFSRAQVFETFKINFAVLQTGLLKNNHKKFIIWVFDVLENEIYDKTLCFWSDKRTNVRIWDVIYFNFAGVQRDVRKKLKYASCSYYLQKKFIAKLFSILKMWVTFEAVWGQKKSRLIHSTRDMGRLLSIWINNPIIIVTNLSNIFCSKDKEQKSWSGIPIFCLQQTFFHDSSQVSNKTTKSRVSLKICI